MRFFRANDARVRNAVEAIHNAAATQHLIDPSIGIGDDRSVILRSDPPQRLAGSGKNLVPITGVLGVANERVAQIVLGCEAKALQQVGVEAPPKSVVDLRAGLYDLVELRLGLALDLQPLCVSGLRASLVERFEDPFSIGEEQSIANIKENDAPGGHESILTGRVCRVTDLARVAEASL